MQGDRYPGQFPYQPGPYQPGPYQSGRPNQPRPRTWLWLLIIVAIALIVGVSVFGIFYFGVFNNSVGGGISGASPTSAPITGNNTPPPSGPCTYNSPYGFTTINADQQLVAFYRQLNVCWVRYQFHWDKIETQPGVYNWSSVDTAIATMNAAGIHVDFAIQSAPKWELVQSCFGVPYLPVLPKWPNLLRLSQLDTTANMGMVRSTLLRLVMRNTTSIIQEILLQVNSAVRPATMDLCSRLVIRQLRP